MAESAKIEAFFDERTKTVSYLVWDPATKAAAVIDPVLDYDPASGEIDTASAELILATAADRGLTIGFILDTHAHADHLSAAAVLKARTGAKTGIGARIGEVQSRFAELFGADDVRPNAGDFDLLLGDGETLPLGQLVVEVIDTPGHTPACVSYRVGDAVFVGDTIFMPDYGTSRTDFPGGDARQLYRSLKRLLALPPETRLFLCHDYKAPGRDDYRWESTVAEQRARNVHIGGSVSEDEFVAMRECRDAQLATPELLLPAVQVNIRGGRLPPPDANGMRYLRIPLSVPDEAGLA